MPYVGKKPADIIATAVDTTTGKFSGEIDAASLDISGNIDVDGTTNLDVVDIDGAVDMASTLTVGGEVFIAEKLTHTGDTDTHIKFAGANDIRIISGNVEHAAFDGTIVLNQSGADMDFRVESSGNANMLFVDAGNDRVGIGTVSPTEVFEVHSGSGNIAGKFVSTDALALVAFKDNSTSDVVLAGASGDNLAVSHDILFTNASKGVYLGVTSATASNLLDDFEEGTWTPQIFSNTTQIGTSAVSGYYTKIGNTVHVNGGVTRDDTASHTDSLFIKNLPFASANTARNYSMTGAIWFDKASSADVVAFAWIDQNVSQILPKSIGTEYNNSVSYMPANHLEHGRPLYFSATYKTT